MKILMSAYSCNPYGVSESFAGFSWLKILLKKYNVVLMTTDVNKNNIYDYYSSKLPSNLEIIAFPSSYPFMKNRIVHETFKVGYFLFNRKMYQYLIENISIVNNADILFHKSPSGFRYFSYLHKFDKPFIFGPTGGGLQTPKVLKEYFKKDSKVLSIRKLDPFLLNRKIYKDNFERAKYILITLGYVRNILGEKYNNKYVEILDTGIDTNVFKHDEQIIRKTPKSILYVGRLTRYKGAELLLKAMANLKNLDFVVDIVGDGEEKTYLNKLVKELHLENKVIFHGFVSDQKKIQKFYNEATIFCFPTITEASGNSLLEAMSYGLPIVTINNGGPKYMCPDDGTYKINIDTAEKMIENLSVCITKLLNSDVLVEKMGRRNREHCIKEYSWEVLEKKIFNIFDKSVLD